MTDLSPSAQAVMDAAFDADFEPDNLTSEEHNALVLISDHAIAPPRTGGPMTTTPDFRALCAELCFIWSRSTNPDDLFENMVPLVDRARAALATPPPKPPTDEERLADFAQWLAREMPRNTVIGDPLWWAPRIARAVLERWGK